jgi:hypothetical protein
MGSHISFLDGLNNCTSIYIIINVVLRFLFFINKYIYNVEETDEQNILFVHPRERGLCPLERSLYPLHVYSHRRSRV